MSSIHPDKPSATARPDTPAQLVDDIARQLAPLYPSTDAHALAQRLTGLFSPLSDEPSPGPLDLWSERDTVLITYADSIVDRVRTPLDVLNEFVVDRIGECLSTIHILPFFPYSSDDGFSVIDYLAVNPEVGEWQSVRKLSESRRVMGDLVLNHASASSEWFRQFRNDEQPGKDYFATATPDDDLSLVVRPRTSPLLLPVETPAGLRHAWCTFGHDQVDLDFSNPDVLAEFCAILKRYLDEGISLFRLDAVGFLWKETGTSCIHLPQTHQVIRVLRQLISAARPDALVITETNVPNLENLSYFGNQNEAHIIYNFSLAPLVLHALLTGQSMYLRSWMMSMPPAPAGCTYLNFTASHDGIGMRPAEGLIPDSEIDNLVAVVRNFGGQVSSRSLPDGTEKVYELNIALFDAFSGTVHGLDRYQIERFLCSQIIMMGLEGIPALYIHSLLATGNDYAGVEATGRSRSINRRQWVLDDLLTELDKDDSNHAIVFRALRRLLDIRQSQPAFHPNATQFTLQLGNDVFGFWRQSLDRSQSIFCISNLTAERRNIRLEDINLISTDDWVDLITGDALPERSGTLGLDPYQSVWISNRV